MKKVLALTAIVFLCGLNVLANYPQHSPFENTLLNSPQNCVQDQYPENTEFGKDAAVQLTPFPEPATLVILGLGTILISIKKRPSRT
ncbi:MAG: hypothetical protein BWY69_00388 [Planctomycetes bacterium ADurb.Bin401]|nr:MAG: hypothetical protein BWY69_00388 [Planctomycetes bacterium ADurb.Bin401]